MCLSCTVNDWLWLTQLYLDKCWWGPGVVMQELSCQPTMQCNATGPTKMEFLLFNCPVNSLAQKGVAKPLLLGQMKW